MWLQSRGFVRLFLFTLMLVSPRPSLHAPADLPKSHPEPRQRDVNEKNTTAHNGENSPVKRAIRKNLPFTRSVNQRCCLTW